MAEPILTTGLFEFLQDLRRNNNREWFAENKARYEAAVKEPAVALVSQLEKPLAKAAPMLNPIAKGHGGSDRMQRDYRKRVCRTRKPYKWSTL